MDGDGASGDLDLVTLAALPPFAAERYRVEDLARVVAAATDAELAAHPEAVLHLAVAAQPGERRAVRREAMDRLARIVEAHPPGHLRDRWAAEVVHDRLGRFDLDGAEEAARALLDPATGTTSAVARARATEGLGRVLAWRGTDQSVRAGEGFLAEAVRAYEQLGLSGWQGCTTVWLATAVHYQRGELDRARKLTEEGLALLDPATPRHALFATFHADLLVDAGRLDQAGAVLDAAADVAARFDDAKVAGFVAWSRARLAAFRRDRTGVRRALAEAEARTGEWMSGPAGSTFLADAAEMADQVGDLEAAQGYLARARQADPDDEFVHQAAAIMLARHGDPAEALAALQALPRRPRLEVRLQWRHTLFAAWATLRARGPGAGELAARAFEMAERAGGIELARASDPDVVAALAAPAARAGSALAVRVLTGDRDLMLHLLGDVRLERGSGRVAVPDGLPGTLLRLLAVHPAGRSVDGLVDTLWPRSSPDAGRRQLRATLHRLRRACGPVAVRSGDTVRLEGVWVDAVAFRRAADRALAAAGPDAAPLATAALALWDGEPLPGDAYADWAGDVRAGLLRRHLALLDLVADDAVGRSSLEEAAVLLAEAIEADPVGEDRYVRLARVELARDRRAAALDALRRAGAAAASLGLGPGTAVSALEEAIGRS